MAVVLVAPEVPVDRALKEALAAPVLKADVPPAVRAGSVDPAVPEALVVALEASSPPSR